MDNLLGVRVDKKSEQEILEIVKKSVDTRKKLYIVTLNTELLVASSNDKKLKTLINGADLVVPESSGLYLLENYKNERVKPKLLRLLKSGWLTMNGKRLTLPEKISGVDLSYSLVNLASEFGYKLLLLGGKEGVAVQASKKLKNQYPNLNVVGFSGGVVGLEDKKILSQVQTAQPDIILVGFGQPKQEKWIVENLGKIPASVAVGVGGTLDFMAGEVPRAPNLVRNIGLEWAFRLAVQPWRIKRQFALVKFVQLLLKSR